jgi:5-methylcytosine-specific restriction endonuclease McrA
MGNTQPDRDPRRGFNRAERAVLGLLAGWRCEICGRDLEQGWHADHAIAHARGGDTDVSNGQALCAACNLAKSAR